MMNVSGLNAPKKDNMIGIFIKSQQNSVYKILKMT